MGSTSKRDGSKPPRGPPSSQPNLDHWALTNRPTVQPSKQLPNRHRMRFPNYLDDAKDPGLVPRKVADAPEFIVSDKEHAYDVCTRSDVAPRCSTQMASVCA